jgi:hypothetical protein
MDDHTRPADHERPETDPPEARPDEVLEGPVDDVDGLVGVEGVDGERVAYRERLHAPWPVWLIVTLLVLSLAVAYGHTLGRAAGVATFVGVEALVVWWLLATAPLVQVDERVLRAGRARLPVRVAGRIAPLDEAQTRDARGRLADPAAFLCTRGWISGSVLVEVEDDEDPHPYWLVSTRHGHDLAAALAASRDAATGADASRD